MLLSYQMMTMIQTMRLMMAVVGSHYDPPLSPIRPAHVEEISESDLGDYEDLEAVRGEIGMESTNSIICCRYRRLDGG